MAISHDGEGLSAELYQALTSDDEGRLCRDIPEKACHHQPSNFLFHVLSLVATKTGDGLADPKLVLTWLLSAMGAPAAAIGLLVPVREALSLLPQLFIAERIRLMPKRKWAWVAGSAAQGLCVAAMAVTAFSMPNAAGGWLIVAWLGLFALARSVCSVSYKDVLGKTVRKEARGTATGSAATVAALLVLAFGGALAFGLIPLTIPAIGAALGVAAGLWLASAALFSRLAEDAGATEGGENALARAFSQIGFLRRDRQLLRFVAVRGFLIATALAPPYMLSLAGQEDGQGLGSLGPFVVASALASVSSAYVWGRLADWSSRRVLIAVSVLAAVVVGVAGLLGVFAPDIASGTLLLAGLLFVLMIAYQGVRLGRSTYLVDMADRDKRAAYTALSNTAIGILLVLGGGFGVLAGLYGPAIVLILFSLMCAIAALLSISLEEVES